MENKDKELNSEKNEGIEIKEIEKEIIIINIVDSCSIENEPNKMNYDSENIKENSE